MPYRWTKNEEHDVNELHLWPHQSLSPGGFALFIGVTFSMVLLPLFQVVGTAILWGLLPFVMLAVAGVWFAINRSQRNARILEVLTLTDKQARLVRHDPNGLVREWACNRYWASAQMHDDEGPVPHYVTLRGGGREVEIGAFLSEEERVELYSDLLGRLRG